MEETKFVLTFDSRGDGSCYRQSLERLRERYGPLQVRCGTSDKGRIRVRMGRICHDTPAVRKDLESLVQRLNESPEWTAAYLQIHPIRPQKEKGN